MPVLWAHVSGLTLLDDDSDCPVVAATPGGRDAINEVVGIPGCASAEEDRRCRIRETRRGRRFRDARRNKPGARRDRIRRQPPRPVERII